MVVYLGLGLSSQGSSYLPLVFCHAVSHEHGFYLHKPKSFDQFIFIVPVTVVCEAIMCCLVLETRGDIY